MPRRKVLSLRRFFGTGTFVLALAPVLAFAALSGVFVLNNARSGISAAVVSLSRSVALEAGRYLSGPGRSLASLDAFSGAGMAGDQLRAWMRAEVAGHPEYDSILLLSPAGIVLATSLPDDRLLGTDYSGQPSFKEALEGNGPVVSAPYISPADGSVTAGVYARSGGGLGLVTLKLDELSSLLGEFRISDRDLVMLADRAGRVVACTNTDWVREQRYLGPLSERWPVLDGRARIASLVPVRESDWTLLYCRDAAEANQVFLYLAVTYGVLGAAAIGAASWAVRRFRRALDPPLADLIGLASSFASGDYSGRLSEVEVEEFNLIGGAFNAMAESIERRDRRITADLAEKVVLLKEIHHRVKNNLQIMASLLSMGSQSIRNPEDVLVFKASQDRVHSMALVHEILYGSGDFEAVDMKEYAERLLYYLIDAYPTSGLQLSMDLEEIIVPLDRALPLGLVLNELITNACKHGLRDVENPGLSVRLHRCEAKGQAVLEVADNGPGFPAGGRTDGLGHSLVTNLARQLDGSLTWSSAGSPEPGRPGLMVHLEFMYSDTVRPETVKPS